MDKLCLATTPILMENIEEDNIANKVLEGLPPTFMVLGKKKELDPVEEFWMSKLTNIERQYDEHIVDLERRLLNDRANKRSIRKQVQKISGLKDELLDQSTDFERLKLKSAGLSKELKKKEFEAKSLRHKLERTSTVYNSISKRLENERLVRMQYEKECMDLRNRLRQLEKEKTQLALDVEIKNSEKARVQERESLLQKEKCRYVRNLGEIDTECRVQTNANLKLCEDMEKLLGIEKSLEVGLLKERQSMGEMMHEMKQQQEHHVKLMSELDNTTKKKRDLQELLEHAESKGRELNRNVAHWKEETEIREARNKSQAKEIKDLKRRNSNIRCILADTRHKLAGCLGEMKSLSNEKQRVEVELTAAQKHEKSLNLEVKKNELRKFKLAEKILKANPNLLRPQGGEGGRSFDKGETTQEKDARSNQTWEVDSYKKTIWKLQRHKEEVDRKLRDLQRKENIYRMKLDKYLEMEKQIFWTGKAMAKLEGDKIRLEQLMKTMESNMPVKVPFRKLVTDPSVLDRLAKNKVLQKRIFQQAEKMEELKITARKILQFREEQFGAMDQGQEDIPSWKLSFWSQNSTGAKFGGETVLSGMNVDIIKGPRSSLSMYRKPCTHESYYKNYMEYLNEEIPKLQAEIDHIERRKNFIEMENESREKSKESKVAADLERTRLANLMLTDESQTDDLKKISEDEDDNDGRCTPDLSMHGSSFDEAKKDAISGEVSGTVKRTKAKKSKKESTQRNDSTEDDEDYDDNDKSSASMMSGNSIQ